MTVTKLKEEMTWGEYQGWIAYYEEKDRKQEAESGNLMAMETDDILQRFT